MARATNLEEAIRVLNPQKRLGGRELDEFYVSRDSRALERIKTLLLQASEVKVLFTGHRGVGKSTELAQLQKDLDQFWTVFFSVFNKLDPNYLDYRDILFSIPLQILLKVKADRQIKLNPKTTRRIEEFQAVVETEKVSEEKAGVEVAGGLKEPFFGLFSFEAKLSKEAVTRKTLRENIAPHLSELNILLSDLVRDIETQLGGKKVLVLVEDIDKADPEVATEIFFNRGVSMSQLPVAIIYAFPVSLQASKHIKQINQYFGNCESLPSIKVREKDGNEAPIGIAKMMTMLNKRLESHLIEESAKKKLILASGGIPRILVQLARDACIEASIDEVTQVRDEDVNRAIAGERASFKRTLSRAQLQLLRQVHLEKDIDVDEKYTDLIHNLSVLEYENGDPWYDVNPVAAALL